jgi:hypothetical protein
MKSSKNPSFYSKKSNSFAREPRIWGKRDLSSNEERNPLIGEASTSINQPQTRLSRIQAESLDHFLTGKTKKARLRSGFLFVIGKYMKLFLSTAQ